MLPRPLPACPQDFSVFTGSEMSEVRAAFGRGDRAWCGLAHLLSDSPNCTVDIAPAGSTYVAVAKPKAWLSGARVLVAACCMLHAGTAADAGG
jgi:hypothetical protein